MTGAQPDFGTPERHQHDKVVEIESGHAGIKRTYIATQTPLDRYLRRGHLGGDQTGRRLHEAGNRFYALFYRAGLSNSVTGGYGERMGGGGIEGYRVLCLDAYQQYMKSREAIRAGGWDVVYSVCCLHEAAGRGARMEMLRLGLGDLAHHFRL